MKRLVLEKNDFRGNPWESIRHWPKIQDIRLDYNQELKGPILTEIGTLTDIKDITITGTKTGGSLPSEIGLLTNLELLAFEQSDLTGTIPFEFWTNFTKLGKSIVWCDI
uniref:Uncharacterized protein n=1 Tax=Cyclophora tenuis TaxID=216820 RepID=A0A6U1SMB3_CYCTE|mmetsp:Transcript_8280/g.14180  ORF Transcript_8280/g.14180 Transcript_8280/m.14180 type:complete len:109 (+) Transcript_8280:86-412(+)